ncbi:MAG: hypothetical protein IPN90_12745 [Elusimicrobia bacterium]|nr:hypothetical protein [Elusimicrobiota bacterium]
MAISVAPIMALAGTVLAVDRYVLDIPPFIMVGDSDVFVRVTPLKEGGVDPAPHSVKFVGLPKGVRLETLAGSPAGDVGGITSFRLVLDPALTDRRIFIRVQKTGEAKISGAGFVNVEKTVARFVLTPLGMSAPRVGVPFRFQVMAQDEDGATVKSFRGTVDVRAALGEVQPTVMAKEDFVDGVAQADFVFSSSDGLVANRLTVTAQTLYPGQSARAVGTVDLWVLPAEKSP